MEAPQPSSNPGPSLRSGPRAKKTASSGVDRLAIALIAAVIIGLSGFGLFHATGIALIPTNAPATDQISVAQSLDRVRAFNTMTPLELRVVRSGEFEQAVKTMGLSDTEKQALLNELDASARVTELVGGAASQAVPATATPSPTQQPQAAAAAKRPLRLAWITLWDTDAQDGDTVRVDSSGFSTTVRLSNTPITFAVPVPEQGVINITGVYDGGGGITIGALSGAQRVALPIMSVGQVLGVPVVAR
jgi:hypothetical protein